MTNKKAVFVSYSWAVEDETNIVDEIETLCPARDIDLIRDRNELKHGDLIDDFMQRLSGGEHIITVFSNPYFQSIWCMYELVEIWKSKKFQQRTHPVIADDCDLQSARYRMDTVEYWVEKYQKLDQLLKGRDPSLLVEEFKKLKLLRNISQEANDIMNFAAGRVTTKLSELRDQQYAQILDQISSTKTEDKDGCFDDEDFLDDVKKHLARDLQKSDVFLRYIKEECSVHSINGDMSNYMIEQCESGEFVELIRNIQSAFVYAYDEIGEKEITSISKLDQAAKGIISKLVLFNIKKDWMRQYREACNQHSHYEYVLPEMRFSSVEVVMSREARTLPEFGITSGSLSLQGGRGVKLESGYRSKNIVNDVISRLYKQVFSHELDEQPDESQAIDDLKRTIQYRRQHKNLRLRKNYFLLLPDMKNSSLEDVNIQNELKSLLPDIAFITLKTGKQEKAFIVEDSDLDIAIREFFITLEEIQVK